MANKDLVLGSAPQASAVEASFLDGLKSRATEEYTKAMLVGILWFGTIGAAQAAELTDAKDKFAEAKIACMTNAREIRADFALRAQNEQDPEKAKRMKAKLERDVNEEAGACIVELEAKADIAQLEAKKAGLIVEESELLLEKELLAKADVKMTAIGLQEDEVTRLFADFQQGKINGPALKEQIALTNKLISETMPVLAQLEELSKRNNEQRIAGVTKSLSGALRRLNESLKSFPTGVTTASL